MNYKKTNNLFYAFILIVLNTVNILGNVNGLDIKILENID